MNEFELIDSLIERLEESKAIIRLLLNQIEGGDSYTTNEHERQIEVAESFLASNFRE